MRTAKLLAALFLSILTATGAAAQLPPEVPPSRLFLLDKAALPQESWSLLLPDAAEEFRVQVDPAAVAANPPSFLIDLPRLTRMEAVRTSFKAYRRDWKSWFGTLRYAGQAEPIGFIHIAFHGDRITALMTLDSGERYQIVGGVGEDHHLVRVDPKKTPPSCGLDASAAAWESGHQLLSEIVRRQPAASISPETAKLDKVRIDVLAVYPIAFFSLSASTEKSMFDFVETSIAQANYAFEKSGVNAEYILKGIVPLIGNDQPPATGVYDALLFLNDFDRQPTDPPSEVMTLRDNFAADIVTLIVPSTYRNNFPCGVANLPRRNNTFFTTISSTSEGVKAEDMGDRAFSAVRSNCGAGDYTLVHEIGHNFGLHHDGNNDPEALSPVGLGYLFMVGTQQKATMMGCTCGNSPGKPACTSTENVCNRVLHYSNPDVYYDPVNYPGLKTGDAQHNEAAALQARLETVRGYRTANTNAQPRASFTLSCSGRRCTADAVSTTDDAYLPLTNYWWDFGDGTRTGGGRLISYTYPRAGSFRVHMVVTDSGGQTAVAWGTANPWDPVYEGYVENINCRQISGWAWDQVIPNTPINVDISRDSFNVATVQAGAFRQDLVNAGKGNGYHGFGYTPSGSSWRDGRWHTVSVRFSNTSTHLGYLVARDIICNVSMFPGVPPPEYLPTGGLFTLGTQFSSSTSGQITHIGFHRASGETGTNTLRLWTDSGGLLRSVTPSCSASGWCWASISPLTVTPGTRYRVSVTVNTQYAKTGCGIGSGITNQNLTAHSGFWIEGSAFPIKGSCSNFFVDVKFDT